MDMAKMLARSNAPPARISMKPSRLPCPNTMLASTEADRPGTGM
jgi:hypothetical protein